MNLGRPALAAAMLLGAGCTPAPRRHVVEIRDLAFVPGVIQVAEGDTIVWRNHDLFPHTATVGGAEGWDTGLIPADGERASVARRAGSYDYLCQVHPTMRGQIVVR